MIRKLRYNSPDTRHIELLIETQKNYEINWSLEHVIPFIFYKPHFNSVTLYRWFCLWTINSVSLQFFWLDEFWIRIEFYRQNIYVELFAQNPLSSKFSVWLFAQQINIPGGLSNRNKTKIKKEEAK